MEPNNAEDWCRLQVSIERYALIERRARELVDVLDRPSCRINMRQVELLALQAMQDALGVED